MKHQEIKSQLIKQSLMVGSVVAVVGGIIGGLLMFTQSYEEKNTELRNEVGSVTAEANKLQEKYTKVQQNIGLYQEAVAKNDAGRLTINHQSVGDTFNHLNDGYYLSNLHLTMSGIDEVKGANYKRKNEVIVSSEVTVTFQAISDEYVYGMLDKMQQDLSGSARLTKLTMRREGDITDTVLQVIAQKGSYPLVNVEMKFLWFGVKPVESKAPDANAVKQN